MKSYDELYALITQRGVHPEFGDAGAGWGIEQSAHELATFLVRMEELGVQSVLEIGTGYKGGLSRFLAADMGWQVTSVDVQDYGHKFEGVTYIVTPKGYAPQMGARFDLVFIDGDHDYDSVKWDYENWGRYAAKAVAFHDIAGWRGCAGALWYWVELARENQNHHDVIALDDKRAGIGWIEL